CVGRCWYETLAIAESVPITGPPRAWPLSPSDVEAVTYNLGLVLGALAATADALPAYLVYLTDLEAGRVASRPGLLGLRVAEMRGFVEAILPITKVAIRAFKLEVLAEPGSDEEPGGRSH
ncbi:MAG TPA: hypothetical protein VE074_13835, partial [Jatrophihabitantaceae bacterium]|nr:hypothetical protein [Jatrophihabitantaceae bacterium]